MRVVNEYERKTEICVSFAKIVYTRLCSSRGLAQICILRRAASAARKLVT
jgi:hypothetical protein